MPSPFGVNALGNQIFASHVPGASTGLSEGGDGQGLSLMSVSRAPGTIPGTVNPPRAPWQQGTDEPVVAASAPPPTAQAPATRVASAAPTAPQQSEGFFSSLARKVGIGGATADTTASAPPQPAAPAKPKAAEAKPLPKAFKPVETKQAAARPALKQSVSDAPAAADPAPAPGPAKDNLVAGAQPIVPPNSFDSRFSAMK